MKIRCETIGEVRGQLNYLRGCARHGVDDEEGAALDKLSILPDGNMLKAKLTTRTIQEITRPRPAHGQNARTSQTMTPHHLADLDELILSCRDEKARALIQEAHACYRAGAYRSAIIATWVAVVYDLFEKLRELALGGDDAAKLVIDGLDAAHAAGENNKLQTLENTILDKCTNDFGFFHPVEVEYLKRLFNDRNRAAHPNHTKHNELFSASAEQARLHFRNAVELVLSQPAKAGKAALDELFALIKASYFPTEKSKACLVLESSPLKKPKRNLFDTFVSGVASAALAGKFSSSDVRQRIAVIGAAFDMHNDFSLDLANGSLKRVFGKTPDDGLKWLLVLLCEVPNTLAAVEESLNVRLEEFIKKGEEEDVAFALTACLRKNIKSALFEERLSSFKIGGVRDVIRFGGKPVPASAINRALDLLSTAGSWPGASEICDILYTLATDLTGEQIQRLFGIASDNPQVVPAWGFPPLVRQLRLNPALPGAAFDEELRKHAWGAAFLIQPEHAAEA